MPPFVKKTELSGSDIFAARCYCEGWTAAETAREMQLSVETIKSKLKMIRFFWTGSQAMSRKDFYARAKQEGIIS